MPSKWDNVPFSLSFQSCSFSPAALVWDTFYMVIFPCSVSFFWERRIAYFILKILIMVGFFQGEYTWKVHWLWNYRITDKLKEAVAKTKNLSEEEMSVIFLLWGSWRSNMSPVLCRETKYQLTEGIGGWFENHIRIWGCKRKMWLILSEI